jgi:hypothetical protein
VISWRTLHATLGALVSAPAVTQRLAARQGGRQMPRVIVCDVNETLLDVGALEPHAVFATPP